MSAASAKPSKTASSSKTVKTKRLGRPKAASGDETRDRLLVAARRCFADFGYAGTSNRHIAEASGLTTGAIYHYFPSKAELYLAAHDAVQDAVYSAFLAVTAGRTSLLAEMEAVLDEALRLNSDDPTLAGFLVVRVTDAQRYPEIAAVSNEPPQRQSFWNGMLERAVARGEVRADDIQIVFDVLRVVNAGLVFAASRDLELQARAIAGVKRLLAGALLNSPK